MSNDASIASIVKRLFLNPFVGHVGARAGRKMNILNAGKACYQSSRYHDGGREMNKEKKTVWEYNSFGHLLDWGPAAAVVHELSDVDKGEAEEVG